jgi:hypothetical protein
MSGKASAAHAGAGIYGIGQGCPPVAGGRSGARLCHIMGISGMWILCAAGPALGKVTATRVCVSIYSVTKFAPLPLCAQQMQHITCQARLNVPGQCGHIQRVQRVGHTATARVCSAHTGIGYLQQWNAPDVVWGTRVWRSCQWVFLASLASGIGAYGVQMPTAGSRCGMSRVRNKSGVCWVWDECVPFKCMQLEMCIQNQMGV